MKDFNIKFLGIIKPENRPFHVVCGFLTRPSGLVGASAEVVNYYSFGGPFWVSDSPLVSPLKLDIREFHGNRWAIHDVIRRMQARKEQLYRSVSPEDICPEFRDLLLAQFAIAKLKGYRKVIVDNRGRQFVDRGNI